jgi:glucose/mannose-6-phosphate isomerase
MDKLIAAFPQQLADALKIGATFSFSETDAAPRNIVISGLGGSGIGGTIVQNYTAQNIKIPLIVNKNYSLPAFVKGDTLVIICSYSGNTEETIQAFEDALQQQAQIICITSGGKIAELASAHHIDCILIPPGMPPRTCLGYSLVQLLYCLNHFSIIDDSFKKDIEHALSLLQETMTDIQVKAEALAKQVFGKLPVIYADSYMEGVAIRWRQQVNENGKMLGWERVLPEMNHNELVGWRDRNENLAVIFLRNESDYERVQIRVEINKKIIGEYTSSIFEIWSAGNSYLEKALYLIHFGDWFSFYLAQKHHVDAMEVKVIDYLKEKLAKTP